MPSKHEKRKLIQQHKIIKQNKEQQEVLGKILETLDDIKKLLEEA